MHDIVMCLSMCISIMHYMINNTIIIMRNIAIMFIGIVINDNSSMCGSVSCSCILSCIISCCVIWCLLLLVIVVMVIV